MKDEIKHLKEEQGRLLKEIREKLAKVGPEAYR